MIDTALMHLAGGAVILAGGLGIFFLVNKKRQDPGGKWVYGTRRDRWQGYCAIGGTLVGYWVVGVVHVVSAAQRGVTVVPVAVWARDICYSGAPCTALVGFLAGLALGLCSSRFIPERSRPPNPDAG